MKTNRLSLITALLLIITVYKAQAQTQSGGLYLTYNDYATHTLRYATEPVNPKGNVILIHEFIGQKKVTVISNGKKQQFLKNTLFGYHDNYNQDYRFFDNKAYQVIDTTGFYIYSYDKLIQQGKGPKPTRTYYFSRKADSPVLPLTPENIAMAFPKNHKFRYMVEVEAKADMKLDAYDNSADEYKIKELFAESLK
jgi:hypothetical protein